MKELVKNMCMEECRPMNTPELEVLDDTLPGPVGDSTAWAQGTSFRSIVGKLQHAANWTRPDIRSAVRKIASNQDKPTTWDWMRAKRVIQYLRGTASMSLIFQANDDLPVIEGYCDASHGSEKADGRSITCSEFMDALYLGMQQSRSRWPYQQWRPSTWPYRMPVEKELA